MSNAKVKTKVKKAKVKAAAPPAVKANAGGGNGGPPPPQVPVLQVLGPDPSPMEIAAARGRNTPTRVLVTESSPENRVRIDELWQARKRLITAVIRGQAASVADYLIKRVVAVEQDKFNYMVMTPGAIIDPFDPTSLDGLITVVSAPKEGEARR
jgi:hypothetical protein